MAYTVKNFKTKKELKEAVKNGEVIEIQNSPMAATVVNGRAFIEGPHWPQPHKWYAEVEVKNGSIIKVK